MRGRMIVLGFLLICAGWVTPSWGQQRCPSPYTADAPDAQGFDFNYGPWNTHVTLFACLNRGSELRCSLVLAMVKASVSQDLPYNLAFQSTLYDNFDVAHLQKSGAFLNGRCQPVPTINLATGEKVWIQEVFAEASDDITSARLVFPHIGNVSVTIPVQKAGAPQP